jgi:hypothetical protein
MKIRLAKPCDWRSISEIHYYSRDKLSTGFFANAPKSFLNQYYRILLNDPNSVILCAKDESNRICGFVSATLDARLHFLNLKKFRFRLALSLLPIILIKPILLLDAFVRFRSSQNESLPQFISFSGPRGEFWVWDSRVKNSVWAVLLYQTHLRLLATLGIDKLQFEVDLDNPKILKFHESNGARLIGKLQINDSRERLLMCYDLDEKFSKK